MPAVPTSLRRDARLNRDRLLAVAHEAFREHGVSASLDDVARRAGVGIGTLYRHFPTRESLILALVADDLERLAELAERLRADSDPDGLERWLEELVRHNLTYRGLAESLLAATGKPNELGGACSRLHAVGASLVRHAQQRGLVRADVDPTDAIELAGAVAWITEGDADNTRRRRLLETVIDGLRAGTGAARS